MKKLFFLFLAAALCLSLCACEKTQPEPPTLPDDGQQTQTPKPEENPNQPSDETDDKQPAPEENQEPDGEEGESGDSPIINGWPKTGIAKRIPTPEKGTIYQITDDRISFRAEILETDAEYAKSYAEKCKTAGFELNVSEDAIDSSTYIFTAENEKGYRLHVSYTGVLIITLAAPQ